MTPLGFVLGLFGFVILVGFYSVIMIEEQDWEDKQ